MRNLIHTAAMIAMASAEAPKGGDAKAAVQNTSKDGITGPMPDPKLTTLSDGRTMGQVLGNMDKKDLKAAYEAADKCYDIQWGVDGIEELRGKLKTLENSVGEQVYKIARIAYTHCEGKLLIVRSYFLALCKSAEEHLTAKHTEASRKAGAAEELPIGKLVPQWPVYKSSIAKGLEMGIDPDERREGSVSAASPEGSPRYPTASKYKSAVEEKAKETGTSENGTGGQAGQGRNTEGQTSTQLQLVVKGWSPGLRAAMDVLCQGLNALGVGDQDGFAPQILELAGRVAQIVAIRKAGPDPAKVVAAQATVDLIPAPTANMATEELDPGTKAAMQAAIDKESAKAPQDDSGHGKGNSKRRGARAA